MTAFTVTSLVLGYEIKGGHHVTMKRTHGDILLHGLQKRDLEIPKQYAPQFVRQIRDYVPVKPSRNLIEISCNATPGNFLKMPDSEETEHLYWL